MSEYPPRLRQHIVAVHHPHDKEYCFKLDELNKLVAICVDDILICVEDMEDEVYYVHVSDEGVDRGVVYILEGCMEKVKEGEETVSEEDIRWTIAFPDDADARDFLVCLKRALMKRGDVKISDECGLSFSVYPRRK